MLKASSRGTAWYWLANASMWLVAFGVGVGLNIIAMCDEDNTCTGAGFLVLGVHLVAIAGSFLGLLFSLIALVRSNERKRLWPLLIPTTIVCAYWAFVVPQFGSSDQFNLSPVRVIGVMTVLGFAIVLQRAMRGRI